MKKINARRHRDHWKCDSVPVVKIDNKHSSFVNVHWFEEVMTVQGTRTMYPMRLASVRVLAANELISAGYGDAKMGLVVGHYRNCEVFQIEDKFYMYGYDVSGNVFYKSFGEVFCRVLYEVSVENQEVVLEATRELFTRLGLM